MSALRKLLSELVYFTNVGFVVLAVAQEQSYDCLLWSDAVINSLARGLLTMSPISKKHACLNSKTRVQKISLVVAAYCKTLQRSAP